MEGCFLLVLLSNPEQILHPLLRKQSVLVSASSPSVFLPAFRDGLISVLSLPPSFSGNGIIQSGTNGGMESILPLSLSSFPQVSGGNENVRAVRDRGSAV